MIDLLKKSSRFKTDEIANFVSKLNPAINQFEKSTTHHFETATTYEIMMRKVIELVDSAESEIFLATRFQNEFIINAMLKKASRGIDIKVISDVNMVEGYFRSENARTKPNDKNQRERIDVVSNPFYPSKIERRYAKVPYCMLIVDQKHVGLEMVDNYDTNKFMMAIFGTDSEFSSQMKDEFARIWNDATVNIPQVKRI